MKKDEFIERLKESLEIENEDISTNTKLREIDGYDSLSILSIIVLVDENFNKKITADNFKSLVSIQDLIDLIGNDNFTD